jgi:hypothetical protein
MLLLLCHTCAQQTMLLMLTLLVRYSSWLELKLYKLCELCDICVVAALQPCQQDEEACLLHARMLHVVMLSTM